MWPGDSSQSDVGDLLQCFYLQHLFTKEHAAACTAAVYISERKGRFGNISKGEGKKLIAVMSATFFRVNE